MEEKKEKKNNGRKTSRILWGIFLIALGVIMVLKNMGVEVNLLFEGWWTLFIIVPSVLSLCTEKDKTGGIIGLLLGTLLLLGARGIIDYDNIWKIFLPAILILIGIDIVFHRNRE